jgi:FAD/FMN-containing dehydrogenase
LSELATELAHLIAEDTRVLTQPQVVERLSRDFYWYSPILRPLLDGKRADVVVQPINVDEIQAILRWCYAHEIPVTMRGAGTGNYGQAVPLHGGVVLDLARMEALEAITPDGVAVCQPGLKLGTLETTAREAGWELRCYPSTIVKASVGGFLGGGSGGIGSVAHGGLRDFATVRAMDVITMEAEPQLLHLEGDRVHEIMHSWGTNGVIARIWLALTPAVEWAQCSIAFETFEAAFDFSESIAKDPDWIKRLITVFEWPIPHFFTPIKTLIRDNSAMIFLLIADEQRAALEQAATAAGGQVTYSAAYEGLKSQPLLSDYTWNHTTLWAMKADPAYTYLQCGFDPLTAKDQLCLLKDKFGDEFFHHIEWMKNGSSVVFAAAIPVVKFSTEDRLNEMIDYCLEIGVGVANPHVNNVEGGGRYRADNVQLLAKYRNDAKGLMNPGKMKSFERANP